MHNPHGPGNRYIHMIGVYVSMYLSICSNLYFLPNFAKYENDGRQHFQHPLLPSFSYYFKTIVLQKKR